VRYAEHFFSWGRVWICCILVFTERIHREPRFIQPQDCVIVYMSVTFSNDAYCSYVATFLRKNACGQMHMYEVFIQYLSLCMEKHTVVNIVKHIKTYSTINSFLKFLCNLFSHILSFPGDSRQVMVSLCCLVSIFQSCHQYHIQYALLIICHVNSESSFKYLGGSLWIGCWWIFKMNNCSANENSLYFSLTCSLLFKLFLLSHFTRSC
jgi:hypothetical protein